MNELSGDKATPLLRLPTSVILARLLDEAVDETITLQWIVEHLRDRSFGIVMLLIALIGLVPGIATVAGLLLAVPAIQMVLARRGPVLPSIIARRRVSREGFERLVRRLIPVLQWMERFVRPRWPTPFELTKRMVGFVILLLCVTLLAPIPFSHVLPLFAVMLLAFAFLEEDGICLAIALLMALISIALSLAAVWGTIEAGLLL